MARAADRGRALSVLVIAPTLRQGGAEAVAAWILEALRDDHKVTLLTLEPVDLARVNRWCGTSLEEGQVRVAQASGWLGAALGRFPLPLDLLRNRVLYRAAAARLSEYDVAISAGGEAWLGRPVIQYVHFLWAYEPDWAAALRWYHRFPGLLFVYYSLARWIHRPEPGRIRDNTTLVNSDFTGREFDARYRGGSTTVYPPVRTLTLASPWNAREDAFLCVGRIVPEKRLERVIEIVARLRTTRPALRLCIAGAKATRHGSYYRHIRGLAAQNSSWITLVDDPDRAELDRLMGRHRYGLHGMEGEHFGMAPAEMARGGALVFVHDSGGQREVVGSESLLRYSSVDDAVRKIGAVLDDQREQARLLDHLREHTRRFSTEAFMCAIRGAVSRTAARAEDI